MSEYKEEPSLLEVREWKRKCQEKYKNLSDEEYLEYLERSSKEIKKKYVTL